MSRRRGGNAGGAVRGPSSALTSFLAGLGVEPSAPLTWGDNGTAGAGANTENDHLAHDGPVIHEEEGEELDPAGAVTARTVEAGPSTIADTTPTKRKRSASIDSDDLDAEGPANRAVEKKEVGEFMDCAECRKKFTVTAYTKEHPKKPGFICLNCTYALGIDPFAKPKKPKAPKAAAKKDDRKKITHYEERKGSLPLADMCINIIGKYIEDVDQLGDIGGVNMEKVCKIISKSRLLTPETALLFYANDRTELKLYDCTRLVDDSYIAMANLCPNLESLHLHLCGQLQTDSLRYWGKHLNLRRLELFGPFLVRQEGWIEFFRSTPGLEGLLVHQCPRIDLETIEVMVDSCPNIKEIRLAEVGKLDDTFVPPLSKLPLEHLDLASTKITDDGVEDLLRAVGADLITLNLSHNENLSDRTADAITAHCPKLQRLYLSNVDLSDEAGAALFTARSGLTHVDMEKGHDLSDASLMALLDGSADSLTSLSLLGWKDVSAKALKQIKRCVNLRHLDVGWCRQFDNECLREVLEGCPVERVSVWGCNQLTDEAPRKRGVKVVGIETHAI